SGDRWISRTACTHRSSGVDALTASQVSDNFGEIVEPDPGRPGWSDARIARLLCTIIDRSGVKARQVRDQITFARQVVPIRGGWLLTERGWRRPPVGPDGCCPSAR